MYSFIVQKITLGKDREAASLTWNKENDTIAVGFNNKSLKLIKIEEPSEIEGEISLSLNHTIPSNHKASINTVSWNERFDKLLSVDSKGTMIIWTEGSTNPYKEEFVNESAKKRIKFAKWSAGGNFVIIIFESGNLVLGSVEGERLWGKTVEMEIEFVTFLENDQVILIGDNSGGLIALDIRKGEIFAEYDFYDADEAGHDSEDNQVVFFEANNSSSHGRLAIGFERGQIYFVHDLRENFLKRYNFNIQKLYAAKWTADGKVLAVSCLMEDKPRIFFLNHHASIISCLNLSKQVLYLDFNNSGDRLLTGFQSSLFLMKVRRPFNYSFIQKEGISVVAFDTKSINDSKHNSESIVYFINAKNHSANKIESENLLYLRADEDKALIISKGRESKTSSLLTVTDKKGNFLYSLKLPCIPENMVMKNSRVLFSLETGIGIWDLSEACKLQLQTKGVVEKPKLYWFSLANPQEISDCTLAPETIFEGLSDNKDQKNLAIVCIDITDSSYLVCTGKGVIKRFNITNFSEIDELVLKKVPRRISANKWETAIACFDSYNNLDICLTKSILGLPGNYKPCFSAENTTDFHWSESSNEFCYSKKIKIYEKSLTDLIEGNASGVHDGVQPKEETEKDENANELAFEIGKSNASVFGYHDMEIHALDVDMLYKILQDEVELPPLDQLEAFYTFKSRKLILIDSMIQAKDETNVTTENELPKELAAYLSKHKDSQLYNYAAQRYLQYGQFSLAEKIYIQLENYSALKFIERLKLGLENETIKRAEALLFIRKPKEAVSLLVSRNHSALVPKLLLAYGELGGISEFLSQLDINSQNQVLKELGDIHIAKGELNKAIRIFEKLDDKFILMSLYFETSNFDKLYSLITEVKSREGLLKLSEWLIKAGNSDLAARALEKAGENKRAVDVALLNNYWSTAVEIAERNDFRQIDGIIHRSASLLSDKRKKLELAELYRKAKKNAEASRILNSLAADLIGFNINPLMIKKVFVLAALEVHLHNKKNIDPNLTSNLTNITLTEMTKDMTKRAMTTLITSDLNNASDRILSNPWRGGEAWHFYILALRLLKAGNFRQAVKVAFKLANFELELGEVRVYAIQAVATYYAGFYKSFSKAVSRLETIYTLNENSEMLTKLEELIIKVFMKKIPEDIEITEAERFNCIAKNCKGTITEFDTFCKVCGSNFSTCVSSGNGIFIKEYIKCNICKQKVLNSEVDHLKLKHCPLCHTKLKLEIKTEKR
jgi:WD repeat-containing protein 35